MKRSNLLPAAKTITIQRKSYKKLLESLDDVSLEEIKVFLAERETAVPEEGLSEDVIARLEKRISNSNA
jgi:hypothetical protein